MQAVDFLPIKLFFVSSIKWTQNNSLRHLLCYDSYPSCSGFGVIVKLAISQTKRETTVKNRMPSSYGTARVLCILRKSTISVFKYIIRCRRELR